MKKTNLLLGIALLTMVIGVVLGLRGYVMYSDPLSFMGGQTWGLVELFTRVHEIKNTGRFCMDAGFITMVIGTVLIIFWLVNDLVNDIKCYKELA